MHNSLSSTWNDQLYSSRGDTYGRLFLESWNEGYNMVHILPNNPSRPPILFRPGHGLGGCILNSIHPFPSYTNPSIHFHDRAYITLPTPPTGAAAERGGREEEPAAQEATKRPQGFLPQKLPEPSCPEQGTFRQSIVNQSRGNTTHVYGIYVYIPISFYISTRGNTTSIHHLHTQAPNNSFVAYPR
jgi:hypothetical protein